MVAAAHPLAVQAGVAVLARGGSAVDAAIAVQMVLNLVEPQSSGIGGGAFMLHFDKSAGKLLAYDGRETAPAAASANMFQDASGKALGFLAAVDGGLSVGTPGLGRSWRPRTRRTASCLGLICLRRPSNWLKTASPSASACRCPLPPAPRASRRKANPPPVTS
jgi:gamma-glutamyltranspeptidase